MISLHGRINSRDYLQILRDQVHPMVQALFSDRNIIFQDDNAPIHTARIVKVQHFVWSAQSSELNIIQQLWPVIEIQVRHRFPLSSSRKEL